MDSRFECQDTIIKKMLCSKYRYLGAQRKVLNKKVISILSPKNIFVDIDVSNIERLKSSGREAQRSADVLARALTV